MKVLHVITGLAVGGAEQQLRQLLRHRHAPAEVVALCDVGAVAEGIRADGVPVHHVPMSRNTNLSAVPRLARLIRAGGFDVVHTHLYRACVYGRVAARLAGVRGVVATEHSLGDRVIENRPVDRPGVRGLYLAAERLGRVTVAVSPDVAVRLERWGVPTERIVTIRNGIDMQEWAYDPAARSTVRARLGIPADRLVVGCVGRLSPIKRVDVLLQAVAHLPEATLLLVGDGSARDALEAAARDLGMADRVVFTGETGDVAAMLSAIDVFASPSPAETFGLALLEAAATGLPITYVAGPVLDDLSVEAPVGRFRRVQLEPSDLAEALRAQSAEPRDRTRVPGLARYDVRTVAAELHEVYERVSGCSTRPMAGSTRGGAP